MAFHCQSSRTTLAHDRRIQRVIGSVKDRLDIRIFDSSAALRQSCRVLKLATVTLEFDKSFWDGVIGNLKERLAD
jgi:hypothetical protein